MPADLLIYAIVAAGLVFWLRNILGTRHGDERDRPNPFTRPPEDMAKTGVAPAAGPTGLEPGPGPALERNMAIAEAAQAGLLDVGRADRAFEVSGFLRGAQDAFVMIVEAFARGDRETLKPLLAEPVYKAFLSVIQERESTGQKVSVEIHAIRKSEIIAAKMDRRDAYVTVRFVADETNVLRDAADMILHGNPDRITETIDVWTFVRDTKSREPGWLLIETSDEDADDKARGTVPDA
ncbi:MAG: Tim44 domain-containing protein [Micavibrio aeruginosavorus]|uniref:Tim44 domain-containing protein n=1 Tax=Micavibrio aeruginosavorus TaxID=349221 RepID=A0A7T5R2S3_9BACT|nr:MAG: Tim44 domain-containing protein [Micavibrio aeruginosavorus]